MPTTVIIIFKKLKIKLLLLSFFLVLFYCSAIAQNSIPSDLSNVQADNISDAQLKQLVQQANTSGLTDDELIRMMENRGFPQEEGEKLEVRIKTMRDKNKGHGDFAYSDTNRRGLNYRADTESLRRRKSDMFAQLMPHVYGSEIFNNNSLNFAPNLQLATPKNYIVGPGDQLNINVYGNSLANWKLEVSPEGNINIPGVGILNIAGKTIEQATESIKSRLSASHYAIGHGTDVQISLGNIRSIKVSIIGELTHPGTYTLPSLATAFTALYAAGGPNKNGTYRQIEIIRNNRIIRTLDIYDFLTKGDQKDNITLQDQDIIRVPTYRTHVEMIGEVKNQAIFEVLPGEMLSDVIRFAGGFTDQAYTGRIVVYQVSDQQRKITDVTEDNYKNYIPLRGDKYVVQRILDRYENRVTISGAVFRPGQYELDKGLTLSGLIDKASGLKEDAFGNRGIITRLNADNTKQVIPFNPKAVLDKSSPDIVLQREDSVYVASIFELRDKYTVTIKGDVRKPGEYAFADSINIADLVIKAGGFAEGASAERIEVGRRITNSDPNSTNGKIAVVYSVKLDPSLQLNKSDFVLRPYDIVSVYSLPGYEKQRTVKVEGEVIYPGYYTLQNKNEKISDIVIRAGGLTSSADADGSSLRRSNIAILGVDKSSTDTAAILSQNEDRLKHLQHSYKDTIDDDQARNNYIGIDLSQILKKPGSVTDLLLEDGDVLRIPKQQQVVKVNGEVLYPSVVVYEKSKTFKDFVLNAGGFAPRALKRGAYVVYPNGTVKGTSKFLFFNCYPSVKPGSEIFIPKKPAPTVANLQTIVALTTGLASIGAIILGIISLHK